MVHDMVHGWKTRFHDSEIQFNVSELRGHGSGARGHCSGDSRSRFMDSGSWFGDSGSLWGLEVTCSGTPGHGFGTTRLWVRGLEVTVQGPGMIPSAVVGVCHFAPKLTSSIFFGAAKTFSENFRSENFPSFRALRCDFSAQCHFLSNKSFFLFANKNFLKTNTTMN